MKTLEKMIKAMQQELMVTKELPHVANIRFLAAVDTAERNLIRERQPDPKKEEPEILNTETPEPNESTESQKTTE
jgi:hypothetical protein